MVTIEDLTTGLKDAGELLEMAVEEDDSGTVDEVVRDLENFAAKLAALEFRRMFAGEMDPNSAYLDIQSGAGGTEAQDWVPSLSNYHP